MNESTINRKVASIYNCRVILDWTAEEAIVIHDGTRYKLDCTYAQARKFTIAQWNEICQQVTRTKLADYWKGGKAS